MEVKEVGRGREREFEVARPRRNDGTRMTVGRWVDGWIEGRVAAREVGRRVTNRTRGRKRVTDLLATVRHVVVARGRRDFRGRLTGPP